MSIFLSQTFILLAFAAIISGQQNFWNITSVLDRDGKYVMTRTVDKENKIISFEVSVQTNGWVGFGLNGHGSMIGAEIVIGGVDGENHYFTVRIPISHFIPFIIMRNCVSKWTSFTG